MEEHIVSATSVDIVPHVVSTSTVLASPGRKQSRVVSIPKEPPVLDLSELVEDEPLLVENPRRFVLFPIEHHDVMAMAKKAIAVFWTAEEIDLTKDVRDWEKLDANTQHFIKHVLGFFAASDGILMENLALNFQNQVQWPEAKYFYANQNFMEAIHCVAPETKILTNNGYEEIGRLQDKVVNVWNGEEFSEVTVRQTSSMAKLIKVKLSNGMFLECTEEHKWFIRKGADAHPERCTIEKVFTKDLKVGDVIGKYELPVLSVTDPDEFRNPYTHGFFCGDGTYCNKYPFIAVYGEKQKLLKFLEVSSINPRPDQNLTKCYITDKINKDKFVVPINYSTQTKLEWLAGILDSDGCTNTSSTGMTAIQLGSIHLDFLQNIQLMLSTLGVRSTIRKNKDAGMRFMPDGKGGSKEYMCAMIWCLYISTSNTHKLVTLGINTNRLHLVTAIVKENISLMRVEEIIDEGRYSPTYCFNEPKKHAGVFNGILTGQSETYSLLIDTYIEDKAEKQTLLEAATTIPAIQKKAEWALQWLDAKKANFATRLIAFAVVEGIFFSGAFCSIFWLKKRGLMPGLTTSNEFIARDEGMHTDFACLLYGKIKHRLKKAQVNKIIKEAVKIEKNFIIKALPCELIGMNADLMSQYIEFVADRLLVQLGYPKIYSVANPFDFMERISLEGKDNFFEKRVTSYAKAAVGKTQEQMSFSMDADF